MRRIRILQLVPSLTTGGAERFVVQLMAELSPARFEVAAVSLYGRQGTGLEALATAKHLRVDYLDKRRGFDVRMFGAVGRVLNAFRPDVVHTHLHALRYLFPAIGRGLAGSVVHTVHSTAERERSRIGRWIPRFLFPRYVVPVAIATEVQESIRRVYGVESICIPNGIPVDLYRTPATPRTVWRQREGFSPGDLLIASVGRFETVKNHRLLIDAFAAGLGHETRSHLLLAGDGILQQELKTHVASLCLMDRVHFLGIRDDIADVLAACDIFAFGSDHEGSPLSVMEAMAAGLPIVGTAVGGVPEMVPAGQAGILVPPRNCAALSAAISSLQRDPTRRAAMARAAARHAVNFDITKMAQSYQALYAALSKPGGMRNLGLANKNLVQ